MPDASPPRTSAPLPAAPTQTRTSALATNATMSETTTSRIYDLWAKTYDSTFGRLIHKRQTRAIQEMRHQPGDRVLDLGIGTGMSLHEYPDTLEVVGMDLSAGMLAKAAEKVTEHGLSHVSLIRGNALETPFADHSFDHVVISHTISVVSEPNKLLHEAKRLVKPDGKIIVLNHFCSSKPVVGWFERVANPLFVKIGWRSDLTLEECLDGVGLRVLYHFKTSAVDVWQIVVLSPRRLPLAAR